MTEAEVFKTARKQVQQIVRRKDSEWFMLRVWGVAAKNKMFIGRFGYPNETNPITGESNVYVWWFSSKGERDAKESEIKRFCHLLKDPTLVYDRKEGPLRLLKKIPVAVVTLKFKGKEYEVRHSYGYGYSTSVIVWDWEDNNWSDGQRRVSTINKFHPGAITPEDLERDISDEEVEVTAFRLVLVD